MEVVFIGPARGWVKVLEFVISVSKDARRGFREYTGFDWDHERRWKEVGGEEYSNEFGECDVFEGEILGK